MVYLDLNLKSDAEYLTVCQGKTRNRPKAFTHL